MVNLSPGDRRGNVPLSCLSRKDPLSSCWAGGWLAASALALAGSPSALQQSSSYIGSHFCPIQDGSQGTPWLQSSPLTWQTLGQSEARIYDLCPGSSPVRVLFSPSQLSPPMRSNQQHAAPGSTKAWEQASTRGLPSCAASSMSGWPSRGTQDFNTCT